MCAAHACPTPPRVSQILWLYGSASLYLCLDHSFCQRAVNPDQNQLAKPRADKTTGEQPSVHCIALTISMDTQQQRCIVLYIFAHAACPDPRHGYLGSSDHLSTLSRASGTLSHCRNGHSGSVSVGPVGEVWEGGSAGPGCRKGLSFFKFMTAT